MTATSGLEAEWGELYGALAKAFAAGNQKAFLDALDSLGAARWLLGVGEEGEERVVSRSRNKQQQSSFPAVLDFASDSNPGGGCRGNQQGTQEESLCRRTSLLSSLKGLAYPIPTAGCAYAPDVAVFRASEAEGMALLPPEEVFWVAVIAASLRNLSDGDSFGPKQEQLVLAKMAAVCAAYCHPRQTHQRTAPQGGRRHHQSRHALAGLGGRREPSLRDAACHLSHHKASAPCAERRAAERTY